MQYKRRWFGSLLGAVLCLAGSVVLAAESDPLPAPRGTPRERAISAYNEGVKLLRAQHHVAAQEKFEQALGLDESMAEAHNNLAFSLRQQGAHNFARSLQHYNRALELKPDLARAYMYRGVLFTQMGDLVRARADHSRLLKLDPELAARLERAITGTGGSDAYNGLTGAYD